MSRYGELQYHASREVCPLRYRCSLCLYDSDKQHQNGKKSKRTLVSIGFSDEKHETLWDNYKVASNEIITPFCLENINPTQYRRDKVSKITNFLKPIRQNIEKETERFSSFCWLWTEKREKWRFRIVWYGQRMLVSTQMQGSRVSSYRSWTS